MSEQQQQTFQQQEEEMIKGVVVVEEWSQPELQAFRLNSPPHRTPKGEDLLVIEVTERGGSSAVSRVHMEAADGGNPKAEEPPPPQQPQLPSSASSSSQEDKKPEPPAPTVGFRELFRFADGLDCTLMAIGTVGAIVHGCSLPIFLRFFADLVNSFGSNTSDPSTMVREVVKVSFLPIPNPPFSLSRAQVTARLMIKLQYAFYFLVVGAAIWASSWAGEQSPLIKFVCVFVFFFWIEEKGS